MFTSYSFNDDIFVCTSCALADDCASSIFGRLSAPSTGLLKENLVLPALTEVGTIFEFGRFEDFLNLLVLLEFHRCKLEH